MQWAPSRLSPSLTLRTLRANRLAARPVTKQQVMARGTQVQQLLRRRRRRVRRVMRMRRRRRERRMKEGKQTAASKTKWGPAPRQHQEEGGRKMALHLGLSRGRSAVQQKPLGREERQQQLQATSSSRAPALRMRVCPHLRLPQHARPHLPLLSASCALLRAVRP
jgi:hypothetical protein